MHKISFACEVENRCKSMHVTALLIITLDMEKLRLFYINFSSLSHFKTQRAIN